jgi:hypothetical protein
MRGLWRLGSFCVSGSTSAGFSFGSPAWARYDHIAVDCAHPCTVSVRFKSDSTSAPSATRTIGFAMSAPTPSNVFVNVTTAPSAEWVTVNATVPVGALVHSDVTLFMTLDGPADVDYFWFHSP